MKRHLSSARAALGMRPRGAGINDAARRARLLKDIEGIYAKQGGKPPLEYIQKCLDAGLMDLGELEKFVARKKAALA